MIPATAGGAIKEEELRAYIKCSQLFFYGGTEASSLATRMAQYTTEYYLAATMRSPTRDKSYQLSRALLQATKACELDTKFLAGQTGKLSSQTALWMGEFWTLFSPQVYLPVTGPLPWRTTVSKTRIDLQISGILRTKKNKTLHVLSFTPYTCRHSQVNDPITHLKLNAMKEFVRSHPGRPRAVLHLLWARPNGSLGYDSVTEDSLNPQYLELIKAKVKEAERGSHFPVLPCKFTCPFKSKCFPGENK